MRLSAYKKSIDEALALPSSIPEFTRYFKGRYSPRYQAIMHIVRSARIDAGKLFSGEFVELYKYAYDNYVKTCREEK